MAEVKWIKITTAMFDDEKIRIIESMPEADSILIIWIKLLTLAGKVNATGYIFLTENIPYTDEMLSTLFNRPLSTVRLALQTFKQFGMINYTNNAMHVTNWDRHQNIEGLDKIREQNKLRQRKHREKQKALPPSNVTVALCNGTDIDIDIDKDIEYIPFREIVSYLNQKAGTKYKHSSKNTKKYITARWNEGYQLQDFFTVIDKKCTNWLNTEQAIYLRPETLFGTKFEGYLNQPEKKSKRRDEDVFGTGTPLDED